MAYTTIDNPELYFQVKTYSGSSGDQAITLDGSENMQPDMVWVKDRGNSENHTVWDSARGVNKYIAPDGNYSEDGSTTGLSAFSTDGFTVANWNGTGASGRTYVAFAWKESATAGFDIVTYTGNSTSGRTVSHSLSAKIHFMLIKNRGSNESWAVYLHQLTADKWLELDVTGSVSDSPNRFNDTEPTTSEFTLGNSNTVNTGYTYVGYLWSQKQGFSRFGTYIHGTGNANGAYIHLGFRPAWVMTKKSSGTGNWIIGDNKRNTGNPIGKQVEANSNGAEYDNERFDLLSNGFKHRASGSDANGTGTTYTYYAFAESPFVNSNGVPCNAR